MGRYPTISLQQARKAAKEVLAERTLGKRNAPTIKFQEAVNSYISTHFPDGYLKPRTRRDTERLLNRHFLPSLRHEKLADIQTHNISRVIDRLKSTPSEARHAFVAARQFFNWAVGRRYIERNPCQGLQPPPPSKVRDRVLTNDELKLVLARAKAEDSNFNRIVQLLIYTGQRRGEIAALRAEWIDFENKTITLPSAITKNKRVHCFPFCSLTEEVLKSGRTEGLLFPARGKDTPFNGWGKTKIAFDEECLIEPWTLHDLRRTFATNLAALGTPVHITEKLLNHISGSTSGIVAVYQRHAYIDEMREAIKRREKFLRALEKKKVISKPL